MEEREISVITVTGSFMKIVTPSSLFFLSICFFFLNKAELKVKDVIILSLITVTETTFRNLTFLKKIVQTRKDVINRLKTEKK